MKEEIRVRFAPSPTGPLHIGGVRTALFNYLFAKKLGGKMLLRIEDTDQNRFVEGAEEYIKECLEWCGIELDESPWSAEGNVGPYRQSERKDIYKKYAQQLVDAGKAYYAFDTPEELGKLRQKLEKEKGESFLYNGLWRTRLKNSLTLSKEEVEQKLASGEPYVIRLKVPLKKEIRLNDMIRGWVVVHSHTIDDKIILKGDGMPTYHLANIVDDHLMGITHVIRGEEWLPSAPLHVLLYQYLGWEDSMPKFAHLPLLLKPNGNGKLSKRDGDKLGFSVFPIAWNDKKSGEVFSGYREDGFLPDAFINFLSLLGWNPGGEQEIFDMEGLIEAFSIEKVGKSGTKFDFEKAKWFNQQYIKVKTDQELSGFLLDILQEKGIPCSTEKAERIAGLMKERVTFIQDFYESAQYFFQAPENYDEKTVRKKWKSDVAEVLNEYQQAISGIEDFNEVSAKECLVGILEKNEMGLGKVMPPLRVAISGVAGGPDLMPILEVLGKEEVANRIRTAIEKLNSNL
ncbi:MAG: glutamate--tRNA ligase [Flammeovirgaceae bacterium]|nr:glutamate--tRNA ligase [Flammeovirgaceae bacterium]